MNFRVVTPDLEHVYLNLAQAYEGEFSKITNKKADADGLFPLDTPLSEEVVALICYLDDAPAGFAAFTQSANGCYEMCEFYIIPSVRRNRFGRQFAHEIWRQYSGTWVVKQIAGAEDAVKFWRQTIQDFHHSQFHEDQFTDPYWGIVTRQQFSC